MPDVWPHVGAAPRRAGFVPGERVEAVLVADVADPPRAAPAPVAGLGRVERLLDYAILGEDDAHIAFATALGWRELTRARRGWTRVSEAP